MTKIDGKRGFFLEHRGDGLVEIVDRRQARLIETEKYKEAENRFTDLLNELRGMLPKGADEIIRKLDDAEVDLEVIIFDAAYRYGLVDLAAVLVARRNRAF